MAGRGVVLAGALQQPESARATVFIFFRVWYGMGCVVALRAGRELAETGLDVMLFAFLLRCLLRYTVLSFF